jgi:hypothetical protein
MLSVSLPRLPKGLALGDNPSEFHLPDNAQAYCWLIRYHTRYGETPHTC